MKHIKQLTAPKTATTLDDLLAEISAFLTNVWNTILSFFGKPH